MAPVTKLYRYDAKRYSVVIDADREEYGVSHPKLELYTFDVIRETPKGYWINPYLGGARWVSKTSRKRFAHATQEEALEGFLERKKAHIRHCKSRLKRAQEDLDEGNRYSPNYGGNIDKPVSRFQLKTNN